MSHGLFGITPIGWAFTAASTGFFYYLSLSFKPDGVKYDLDPMLVEIAKEYQPGIKPEYYYKRS